MRRVQVASFSSAKALRAVIPDENALLRLTELVEQLAKQLGVSTRSERTGRVDDGEGPREWFSSSSPPSRIGPSENIVAARLARATRPPLPDPRFIRKVIRQRHLRARYFDGEFFSDPVWDILLDLTAARAEHKRVSVTSACIASGVPVTTALRWIKFMVEAGLIERSGDDLDKRRTFVSLTDQAADLVSRYFADIGQASNSFV